MRKKNLTRLPAKMISRNRFFISRIHFLVQLLIFQSLFSVLFVLTGTGALATDREGSLLFFAIGSSALALSHIVEFLTRDPSEKSLSGLAKARKSAICYRQMVFMMCAIFASMIFGPEYTVAKLLFPLFAFAGGLWLVWSNLAGFRMLHRRLYRTAQAAIHTEHDKVVPFPALSKTHS